MKQKSMYISIVLLAIIIAPVLLLMLSGCGFLAIALEEPLAKIAIDNPHVNDNYADWQKTELGENVTVLLPDGWTLSDCDTYTQVLDENGKIVAYAASFRNENAAFEKWADFFSEIYGMEVAEADRTLPGGVTSGGDASYCEITLNTDNADQLYCLMLYDNSEGVTAGKGTLIVFPADNNMSYEAQLEIIAAISFSHEYAN